MARANRGGSEVRMTEGSQGNQSGEGQGNSTPRFGANTDEIRTTSENNVTIPGETSYARFDTSQDHIFGIIFSCMKAAKAVAIAQTEYEFRTNPEHISTTVAHTFTKIKPSITTAAEANPQGVVTLASDILTNTSYADLLSLPEADNEQDDSTPAAANLLVSAVRARMITYETIIRKNVRINEAREDEFLKKPFEQLNEMLFRLGAKQLGGPAQMKKYAKVGATYPVYDTQAVREKVKKFMENLENSYKPLYYLGEGQEAWVGANLWEDTPDV